MVGTSNKKKDKGGLRGEWTVQVGVKGWKNRRSTRVKEKRRGKREGCMGRG